MPSIDFYKPISNTKDFVSHQPGFFSLMEELALLK
jgi:hypothetical protein